MSIFSSVWASFLVWNRSIGWVWFLVSYRVFRLRWVSANGRFCSLGVGGYG